MSVIYFTEMLRRTEHSKRVHKAPARDTSVNLWYGKLKKEALNPVGVTAPVTPRN